MPYGNEGDQNRLQDVIDEPLQSPIAKTTKQSQTTTVRFAAVTIRGRLGSVCGQKHIAPQPTAPTPLHPTGAAKAEQGARRLVQCESGAG